MHLSKVYVKVGSSRLTDIPSQVQTGPVPTQPTPSADVALTCLAPERRGRREVRGATADAGGS